ncbi:MAG TPA: type II secretion system minor pseudopilin GspK [Verrucomicrobiae bacterium]|nr:type II secretion system minor pseudopilin GspK [Verrucomicrobiae bacterium]
MRPRGSRINAQHGVALIIVLWIVMVLSLLITGFAFRMHVETQVASFSRKELKAEMLARSGVEIARMQLILDQSSPTNSGFDALNQAWATNDEFYVDHELGMGKFNVTVTDEESKLPINGLTQDQLKRLTEALGLDPLDGDVIVDSVLDWIDGDDLHRLNGAESDYYESLSPPYDCKNRPLDRVDELLLIRGVTKEIYYGKPATEDEDAQPGLSDLVTTTTSGQVNVNTARAPVLQALLGLDDSQVAAILDRRDGADGLPGTEDDQPFRAVGDFISQLGALPAAAQQQLAGLLTVNSTFFTVKSTGEVGGVKRTVVAVMRRQGADLQVVTWKEIRGGA